MAELRTSVEYLKAATARVGKFDWRELLRAQLIRLVLAAVIPQDALRVGLHFLSQTIGHLFGGGPPELPWGPDMLA